MYNRTDWKDHIVDADGNVVQEGTPLNAANLQKIEQGVVDVSAQLADTENRAGMLSTFNAQQITSINKELEKYKKQRLLQGRETISNDISDDGYFRNSEPFKTVSLDGFPQINSPNYDVLMSPTSSDVMGAVGSLEAYDKTQNGFKVKMTGSAKTVSFFWTLINPNV